MLGYPVLPLVPGAFRFHADAPQGLFFTGSLWSLSAIGRGLRFVRWSLGCLDLNPGLIRQPVGAVGYDFVAFLHSSEDLYVLSVADAELDSLLVRHTV